MRLNRMSRALFLSLILMAAVFLAAAPQERPAPPRAFTAADYAQAEKFMTANVSRLVFRSGVRPNWLAGDAFWYRNALEGDGGEFILVDPAKGKRAPAFDHAAVAAALSEAAGKTWDEAHLPFQTFEFSADRKLLLFQAGGLRWSCDVAGEACTPVEGSIPPAAGARRGGAAGGTRRGMRGGLDVASPDGKLTVFIENDNLWLREIATGAERALTTDGVKDFGYATDNAGWTKSDRPVVLWSPDSKKIATFQQDQRGVGEMYLVETKVGHPTLSAWKYPLPGDETVTTIQRVIIYVDGPRVVRLKMAPDQHRGTLADDIKARGGGLEDAQWSPDSASLAFVSTSRDHKVEVLRQANIETGDVRDVLEEKVETFFESGQGRVNWRWLPATSECIWFSERDNWGHLYLYDFATGKLKSRITSGEGNVTQMLSVDEKARTLTFIGVGREKGRDPYFRHLYAARLDGTKTTLLTPEDGDHEVTFSPSGKYFIDSYSKPDAPPVSVLRGLDGKLLAKLETADISKLLAIGWKPPMPFTVKARDGQTDLYGLLFRPAAFDPAKKYPIINYIYPGPQTGSVGSRSFSPARGDHQALAELGFVVVMLDGMGTPLRSKKFHDAYYGDMGDNTLPDQVAGMKELAARFAWIDIAKAGIWGHSGGGYAAADAMFRYPDFFKVGISEAGNHDNRGYEDDWGEKYQGLLVKKGDGASNYDSQANQNFAKNLKGKLLLAHGTMDNNVPPYLTLLVVNELIKANKDFDLLLLPNRGHGFGSEPYMIRRRWDYFVRNLLGAEPPAGYELRPAEPRIPPGR